MSAVCVITTMMTSCNNRPATVNKGHISDSLFWIFNGRFNGKDSTASFKALDSLYKTIPEISGPDRFYYFSLLRTIRYNNDFAKTNLAIAYTDSMLDVITSGGLKKQMKKEYLRTLVDKANLYVEVKKYQEAIELIAQCRFSNTQDGDSAGIAENIFSIAYIAFKQEKIDTAINLLKEGYRMIKYFPDSGYRYFRSQRALDDLGYMYRVKGELDSALKYHKGAEKIIISGKDPQTVDNTFRYQALMNIYENITVIYLAEKKADSARKYIDLAIYNIKKIADGPVKNRSLANLYQKQALAWFMQGNFEKADSFNKVVHTSFDIIKDETKLQSLELDYKLDSVRGDFKSMAEDLARINRFRQATAANTIEALKNDPQELYSDLERKYELDLKERSIRLQQTKTRAAVITGILLLLLAGTLLLNLKKLRRAVKKLRETMRELQIQQKQKSEEQLRFQEVRLQIKHNETISRQRREISNDLHDSLSSSLAALRYYIEDLKLRDVNKGYEFVFDDIKAEVNTIYTTTRQYMHDLNSGKSIVQHDLPGQLEELADKFDDNASFSIVLEINKEDIEERLDINQQDQLYYIINEAVSNTIKYAGATRIAISISFIDDSCLFSISDNGSGFDLNKVNSGLGLRSMHSRIEKLNGSLQILSGNAGTTISGSFPVLSK